MLPARSKYSPLFHVHYTEGIGTKEESFACYESKVVAFAVCSHLSHSLPKVFVIHCGEKILTFTRV